MERADPPTPATSAGTANGTQPSQDKPAGSSPGTKARPVLPQRPAKKQAASAAADRSSGTAPSAAPTGSNGSEQATLPSPPDSQRSNTSTGRRSASGTGSGSTPAAATSHASNFMPTLPPRQAATSGPSLDPDEPEDIQQIRTRIHDVRVSLIRAALRLGYDANNGLVRQVIYRLALAEKLKAPWRRERRRPDPAAAAAREAARLESAAAAAAAAGSSASQASGGLQPLGFCVRMMLVGLAGTGKTQLIHALLGHTRQQGTGNYPTWPAVDPIEGATRSPRVHKGEACGIPIEIMDTPGLLAAAAGTAHNQAVLQQIKRAYRSFKPDLILYVDRLDAGGSSRWGGELPALQGLSNTLGPGIWLNTIVALTHAGSSCPHGARGTPLPYDQWAQQRSHALQQVIRAASGDDRLMNPTAYVESHPATTPTWGRDSSGVPLLFNGMAWRPHLLLMMVSAKLLAETENMLQMQTKEAGAGASAAAQQALMSQMMGGPSRTLPIPFLVSQATQFSQPLRYPDHEQVMTVRRVEAAAALSTDPRQTKQLVRQAKAMKLQIKQAIQYQEKMARCFRMATVAGSKITPVPPPLATKRPPSAHPPSTYRYRVPEASGGWTVRPSMEPHGMDVGDGIEGLQMEHFGVLGRNKKPKRKLHIRLHKQPSNTQTTTSSASITTSTPQPEGAQAGQAVQGSPGEVHQAAVSSSSQSPAAVSKAVGVKEAEDDSGGDAVQLGGVPAHHFLSAQATKGALMLQGRTEATFYHDPLGRTTTALSADVQASSSGGGPLDALISARADVRRKNLRFLPGKDSNSATAGLLLARLAEGGRPDRGPVAMGVRLQHTHQATLGGGMPKRRKLKSINGVSLARTPAMPRKSVPVDVAASLAMLAAPWGSTSQATAASLAALGSPPPATEPEVCLGGNLEVTAEVQELLGTRKSAPLTLAANMVRYKGEVMTGLATSLQLQGKRKDVCAVRLQLSNKGKAGINLKVRSGPWWWMGLVAMTIPFTSLLLELAGLIA